MRPWIGVVRSACRIADAPKWKYVHHNVQISTKLRASVPSTTRPTCSWPAAWVPIATTVSPIAMMMNSPNRSGRCAVSNRAAARTREEHWTAGRKETAEACRYASIAPARHGRPARGRIRLRTMVYLDHAATTPMLPEALDAYVSAAREVGNPSSLHASGRRARRMVEEAREQIAAALGARPSEVVFTAGGTESDNLAVKGLYWARRAADSRRTRVLASSVEHHAVFDSVAWLEQHEEAEVTWLDVDSRGRICVDQLHKELEAHGDEIALVTA